MTALTFGPSDAPLIGVYHPSAARARPNRAVILCHPFGEEAIRAFRPFKRLAESFAASGIPAFRFDYLGTGDSFGEDELVTIDAMADSLVMAHHELSDLSEVRQIYWVGLRLGAWAALRAASIVRPAGLILWEPVTDGQKHCAELEALPGARYEALGFPVSEDLRKDLQNGAPELPEGLNVKIIGHEPFQGQMPIQPPDREEWNSDDALNSFTMPIGTLDLISREVTEW